MKERPVFWIIAGTTEGRELVENLRDSGAQLYVSLATEYGMSLIEASDSVCLSAKRMDRDEMINHLREITPDCVIDATHPYAEAVTDNISKACAETGIEYIRLTRPESDLSDFIYAEDSAEAARFLGRTKGAIFLTCGSKNIEAFTCLEDYQNRIFARVLPMQAVMEKCEKLGFKSANMIYMQGPFSREMNTAMFRAAGAEYLVTKDSGDAGGFREKVDAALNLDMKVLVIGRPKEKSGSSFEEVLENLLEKLKRDRFKRDRLKFERHTEDHSLEFKPEIKAVQPYFPMFIKLQNKRILVFGGGRIAARRITTILKFDAGVHVISPDINEEIMRLSEKSGITMAHRAYEEGDCTGADIVLAATSDSVVNRLISEECKRKMIPVSVADNKELGTFFFPAVILKDNMVVGVTASGENHRKVRIVRESMQKSLDEILE